ncbi:hypothetical protein PIB30_091574 [Stylosanthes scabra]|uniref:Uncharacterized protein n=1 Tax=Stylosanthes scabra TaxID=79078 RepID=A0ABU6XX29_9FABA|nr:hypothetical protein [Stylosanthes scabra]
MDCYSLGAPCILGHSFISVAIVFRAQVRNRPSGVTISGLELGIDVLFFEYPPDSRYVEPATGGAVLWGSSRMSLYYLAESLFSHPLLSQEFNPDMPLSELYPYGCQHPFPPYPLNVAEPKPKFPTPQVPEYPP